MAEASMEDRPPTNRFFCHKCNIHFQNTTDFTCPQCSHGFVEELDVGDIEPDNVDDDDDLVSSDDEVLQMMNMSELERLFTSGLSRQRSRQVAHRPGQATNRRNPSSSVGSAASGSSGSAQNHSNRRRRYAEFRFSASRNRQPHFIRWPANSRSQTNNSQTPTQQQAYGPSPFENLIQDFIVNLGGVGWTADFTAGGGGPHHHHNAMHLLLPANPGDYAWGREGLDAIVTQLLNQMDSSGPPPLQSEAIEALPLVSVTEEQVSAKLQCSVCWDDFKLDEQVKMLPCQHMYHDGCIVPWLTLHGTCPICRKVLQVGATGEVGSTEIQSNNDSHEANGNSTFNTLQQLFHAVQHGGATSTNDERSTTTTNLHQPNNQQQNDDSND